MGQFDATKGKQALEIRSSLSERRALTDPILPGDSADLAHAHSRQWAKAHGEFKTQTLHFILKYLFVTCYNCPGKPPSQSNDSLSYRLAHMVATQDNHTIGGLSAGWKSDKHKQLSPLPPPSANEYLLMT